MITFEAPVVTGHAQFLIDMAARAPSVHNSQPWRFRIGPSTIEFYCDKQRKLRTDILGREMLISCGAALFGLRLGVRSLGYLPVVQLLPDPARPWLVARVGIGAPASLTGEECRMLEAVPHRHTHRGPFEPGPLPDGLLRGLRDDALAEGATLTLVKEDAAYQRLAGIVLAAADHLDLDSRTRDETLRWTRDEDSHARDGVSARTFAASAAGHPGRLTQRDFDLGRGLARLPAGGEPPAATAVLADARRELARMAARRAGSAPAAAARGERTGVREPIHPAAGASRDSGPDPGPAGATREPAGAAAARLRQHHGAYRPPPGR